MKTHFITDDTGKKISVVLPISEYQKMIEELEDLEDIKLYDNAKKHKEPSIPIELAFKQLDSKRK
jgi:hypothetical protein